MAEAKIFLNGVPIQKPKIKSDGSADLLFSISDGPKESFCLVHACKELWDVVSPFVRDDSNFVVKGTVGARINNKGLPFIDSSAYELTIKYDGSYKKAIIKYNNSVAQNSPQEYKSWYEPEEIIYLNAADVCLTEKVHVEMDYFYMGSLLKAVSFNRMLKTPLAVRPIEGNKYSLVMGIKGYIAAKLLNMEQVPVVIRNQTHDELLENQGMKNHPKAFSD